MCIHIIVKTPRATWLHQYTEGREKLFYEWLNEKNKLRKAKGLSPYDVLSVKQRQPFDAPSIQRIA